MLKLITILFAVLLFVCISFIYAMSVYNYNQINELVPYEGATKDVNLTNLTVDNLKVDGNINVSGCVIYNGGVLGECN